MNILSKLTIVMLGNVMLLWSMTASLATGSSPDDPPYAPDHDARTHVTTAVLWLQALGFEKVEVLKVHESSLMLTGYFPCPELPNKNWEPLCPDGIGGVSVPHELLLDTLRWSLVLTTFGKNHPLGPWLQFGVPPEVRDPYDIANPARVGQCPTPQP
jgi:hypothetical protein